MEDRARLWDRSSRAGGCRAAMGDSGEGLSSASGAEDGGGWSTSADPHLSKLALVATSSVWLSVESSGAE